MALSLYSAQGILSTLMDTTDKTRCCICGEKLGTMSFLICKFPASADGDMTHVHNGHTACSECASDRAKYIGDGGACRACLCDQTTGIGTRDAAKECVAKAGVALIPPVANTVANVMIEGFEAAERHIHEFQEANEHNRIQEGDDRRLAAVADVRQRRAEAEAEAQRIASEAERLAVTTRETAEAEARRIAEEAQHAADTEAAEARQRAEAEAQRIAEEAERLAVTTRETAEAEARRIAEEAQHAADTEAAEARQRAEAEAQRIAEEAQRAADTGAVEARQRAEAEGRRIAEEAQRAAEALRVAVETDAAAAAQARRVAERTQDAAEKDAQRMRAEAQHEAWNRETRLRMEDDARAIRIHNELEAHAARLADPRAANTHHTDKRRRGPQSDAHKAKRAATRKKNKDVQQRKLNEYDDLFEKLYEAQVRYRCVLELAETKITALNGTFDGFVEEVDTMLENNRREEVYEDEENDGDDRLVDDA